MKRYHLFKLLLIFLITFTSPIAVTADNKDKVTIPVKKTTPIKHDPDKERDGDRAPARPIIISISAEYGVSIPAVDKDNVLSYSIYDEDGMLLASFTDDMEFATALLSSNGTLEIRIHLDDYTLCGWIEL